MWLYNNRRNYRANISRTRIDKPAPRPETSLEVPYSIRIYQIHFEERKLENGAIFVGFYDPKYQQISARPSVSNA